MSWKEVVRDHPLWPSLADVLALCDEVRVDLDNNLTRDSLNRIRSVLSRIASYRDHPQPERIVFTALDVVRQHVSNIRDSVASYRNNPDAYRHQVHAYARDQIDAVLAATAAWPPLPNEAESVAAARAASGFVDDLEAVVAQLNDRVTEVRREVEEAQSADVGRVAELEGRLEVLRAQIRDAENLSGRHVARLDEAITRQQEAAQVAQSERAERFDREMTAWRERTTATLEAIEERATERAAQLDERASQHLDRLGEFEAQAETLVLSTSRRVITTEHGQYADDQRRQAFWWSVAVIIVAVGGAAWIIFVINRTDFQRTSWQLAAYRLGATLTLLAVAGYAAKQAAEHRAEERAAKRTQLVINALEPFLKGLPEEKANEMRVEIARSAFGTAHADTQDEPRAVLGIGTTQLGEVIGQAVRQITGK